jgi:hypothetical protein
MYKLILIGALTALAGCENYTDQTSPCFDRSGKPVVSRNSPSPVLSFAPDFIVPEVSRNSHDPDCLFRPVGADA